jgi:hypothetical protein
MATQWKPHRRHICRFLLSCVPCGNMLRPCVETFRRVEFGSDAQQKRREKRREGRQRAHSLLQLPSFDEVSNTHASRTQSRERSRSGSVRRRRGSGLPLGFFWGSPATSQALRQPAWRLPQSREERTRGDRHSNWGGRDSDSRDWREGTVCSAVPLPRLAPSRLPSDSLRRSAKIRAQSGMHRLSDANDAMRNDRTLTGTCVCCAH